MATLLTDCAKAWSATTWYWKLDKNFSVCAKVHPLVTVSIYQEEDKYTGYISECEEWVGTAPPIASPTLVGLLRVLHEQAATLLAKKLAPLSLVSAQGRYAMIGETVSVTRPANADGSNPWTAYGKLVDIDSDGGAAVLDADGHRHLVWLSDCVIEEPITK